MKPLWISNDISEFEKKKNLIGFITYKALISHVNKKCSFLANVLMYFVSMCPCSVFGWVAF